MNQKGFSRIVLVILVVVLAGTLGYATLIKKSTPLATDQSQTNSQNTQSDTSLVFDDPVSLNTLSSQQKLETNNEPGQGASVVVEKDRIQVVSPKGGEKLEVGKMHDIRWTNYFLIKEPLTIALQITAPDNKVYSKIIISNVPAAFAGSYKWTIPQGNADAKYKIEVYPAGGRELVGRSKDFFTIFGGEQLITITSPKPMGRVNASQPIIITGKARKVFNEGEFDVFASYILSGKKQVVARTFATCNISGSGCDWTSGNFVDFKATLDLSSYPVCYVNVEFYKRDEKNSQTQPFYELPLSPYGNSGCQ